MALQILYICTGSRCFTLKLNIDEGVMIIRIAEITFNKREFFPV